VIAGRVKDSPVTAHQAAGPALDHCSGPRANLPPCQVHCCNVSETKQKRHALSQCDERSVLAPGGFLGKHAQYQALCIDPVIRHGAESPPNQGFPLVVRLEAQLSLIAAAHGGTEWTRGDMRAT
jgi:hypothetical protein